MQQAIQLKTTIPPGRNSSNRSPWRGGLFLIALTLALFGLSPTAQAVTPAPDGGYPDFNTAEGDDALFSLTTGVGNAAIGTEALFSNTTGTFNTATGVGALLNNTTASNNTATGAGALFSNTTIGVNSGHDNTATGFVALYSNTTGTFNTACGSQALGSNTTGGSNTAVGFSALASSTGGNNTAVGESALVNTSGSNNIALGAAAGITVMAGINNIDIGNVGADESATIRIGSGVHTKTFIAGIRSVTTLTGTLPVVIDANGQLGVGSNIVVSSNSASPSRFKQEMKAMKATVAELKSLVAKQQAIITQQKKGMEAVTARLDEQQAQIQKVSAQLEVSKPPPQVVVNNP